LNSSVEKIECPTCEGMGQVNMSCCSYNLHTKEIKICPACDEHCGEDSEPCEQCDGLGELTIKTIKQI